MRHLFYQHLVITVLAVLVANCGKSETDGPPIGPNPDNNEVSFTDKDATAAYNNFNNYFYSSNDRLYYGSTEKKNIGAIWCQAIYWDMAMDAYRRTNESQYKKLMDDIYEGAYNRYDKFNWNNKTEWFIYDDMMWWIISLTRAFEITKDNKYLELAKSGFHRVLFGPSDGSLDYDKDGKVYKGAYDEVNSGLFWDFKRTGKNACITFPTIIAAVNLYNLTGEKDYLQKATRIYSWAVDSLYDKTNGRVADNNVNGRKGWDNYTYNQGTFIGASVLLYKATNNLGYLENAVKAADYTKSAMCNADGILPAEGDWNEQGVLKAIFGRYVMMLINDGGKQEYLPWIQHNVNKAWGNRDPSRGLTYRNYNVVCPSGTIQSYEASSAVAIMQLCPPGKK
ncbi:glycoside hydrolase family 76 protein [Danxiaibacter flavus]|uniref:Glycoside hydrolase family 76 protein n=1 Tax=Danxiaibacter flavus TaxID=3049108 RepID=A0ABV3ZFF2_9BACT|nr:glycoside hydrolase family 76 protein [Chitinophagaceae bacterium DXS]